MLNGISLAPVMHRLRTFPEGSRFQTVAARLRARLLTALCISQACWWTAVLIGLVNSTLRRWAGNLIQHRPRPGFGRRWSDLRRASPAPLRAAPA